MAASPDVAPSILELAAVDRRDRRPQQRDSGTGRRRVRSTSATSTPATPASRRRWAWKPNHAAGWRSGATVAYHAASRQVRRPVVPSLQLRSGYAPVAGDRRQGAPRYWRTAGIRRRSPLMKGFAWCAPPLRGRQLRHRAHVRPARACIGPGDGVITVAHTAVATVPAARRTPTPTVDIDRRCHGAIALWPQQSRRPRLPVGHLYVSRDMDTITEICPQRFDHRGIAQAHGAPYNNKPSAAWRPWPATPLPLKESRNAGRRRLAQRPGCSTVRLLLSGGMAGRHGICPGFHPCPFFLPPFQSIPIHSFHSFILIILSPSSSTNKGQNHLIHNNVPTLASTSSGNRVSWKLGFYPILAPPPVIRRDFSEALNA